MISSKSPCTAMIILISGFIPLVALVEKNKKTNLLKFNKDAPSSPLKNIF